MSDSGVIWLHFLAALAAIVLGAANLVLAKGTPRHKAFGWAWIAAMLGVTLPSFSIREANAGEFSWLHGLTVWTLFCMLTAIIAIRRRRVRTHAAFMSGTMIGATIAGAFALTPGRFISDLLGY